VKILVFGGSFDPIHYGHLLVADRAQKDGGFDEVWFTPCQESRYGKKLSSRFDRVTMLKMGFDCFGNDTFRISNSEFECGAHGKMYDLAVYLREKHPDFEFEYLIGQDSFDKINSWYRAEELTTEFKFVTVPRSEKSISSSMVRNDIKLNGKSAGTPVDVNEYVKERQLYV
jgi:nicotinate-nucleotide adenylyltransferase